MLFYLNYALHISTLSTFPFYFVRGTNDLIDDEKKIKIDLKSIIIVLFAVQGLSKK